MLYSEMEAVSWTQESGPEAQDAPTDSLGGLHEAGNVGMA